MKILRLAAALSLVGAFVPCRSLRAQLAEPAELRESAPATIDDDGPLSEPRHIRFGVTPDDVVIAMKGRPDARLSPDIWVYWHFQAAIGGAQKFDTLVVFFSRDRVTKYRLVERQPIVALLAQLRAAAPPAAVAATR